MSCPTPESWVDFLDSELPDPDREALVRHLIVCPGCRETFVLAGNARQAVAVFGRVAPVSGLSPQATASLIDALGAERLNDLQVRLLVDEPIACHEVFAVRRSVPRSDAAAKTETNRLMAAIARRTPASAPETSTNRRTRRTRRLLAQRGSPTAPWASVAAAAAAVLIVFAFSTASDRAPDSPGNRQVAARTPAPRSVGASEGRRVGTSAPPDIQTLRRSDAQPSRSAPEPAPSVPKSAPVAETPRPEPPASPAAPPPEEATAQAPAPAPEKPVPAEPAPRPVGVSESLSVGTSTPSDAQTLRRSDAPAAPAPGPTQTTDARVVLTEISGQVLLNDRPAKAGDAVGPADRLSTPYGAHGHIVAQGASIILHHRTEAALISGPVVRLAAGRIFVKSAPGLRIETPAGTLTPIGTEFSVELADRKTVVAVREGKVRCENAKGAAEVPAGYLLRTSADRPPGKPEKLADTEAYFSWAVRATADRSILVYPVEAPDGVVVAAPHVPDCASTDVFAAEIAQRLKVAAVVGRGYGTNRIPFTIVDVPGQGPEWAAVFRDYVAALHEAAGRKPVRLLVELHTKGPKKPNPDAVDAITNGFDPGELEAFGRAYDDLVRKHRPANPTRILFDPSPRDGDDPVRKEGSLSPAVSDRGMFLRLPPACRGDAKSREQYFAILAEWIETIEKSLKK